MPNLNLIKEAPCLPRWKLRVLSNSRRISETSIPLNKIQVINILNITHDLVLSPGNSKILYTT